MNVNPKLLAVISLLLSSAGGIGFLIGDANDKTGDEHRIAVPYEKNKDGNYTEFVMTHYCQSGTNSMTDLSKACEPAYVVRKRHLIPEWQEEYLREKDMAGHIAERKATDQLKEKSKAEAFKRFEKGGQ